MRKTAAPSLDAIDLKVLALLQDDARTPNAEIGRRVGMVPSAIFQRLRKLQKLGVIVGHETQVDPRAVGLGLAAFVFVQADERVGNLGTALRLARLPEVQEVHHVAPHNVAFGLGRMYATYRELNGRSTKQVEVFRSLVEALAFLGVKELSW